MVLEIYLISVSVKQIMRTGVKIFNALQFVIQLLLLKGILLIAVDVIMAPMTQETLHVKILLNFF
jgi:hypothetical protein